MKLFKDTREQTQAEIGNMTLEIKEKKWKSLSRVWLFVTPRIIYSPWNSPGQNTWVGSLSLFQGIFPTQGSNGSSALQEDSLSAELQGSQKKDLFN